MMDLSKNTLASMEHLIYEAAAIWPERTVIEDSKKSLSYRQLAQICESTKTILHDRGFGPGSRVALYTEKNADALATMLALMASGVAVVVLPYNQSTDLLLSAIKYADVHLLITGGDSPLYGYEGEWLQATTFLNAYEDITPALLGLTLPDDPAYMIFTSGSTGDPKSVVVTHANIMHYTAGLVARLGLKPDNPLVFAHVTMLAADLGYTCIFPTLVVGGKIRLFNDAAVRDPVRFWAEATQAGINYIKTTPTHFRALIEARNNNAAPFDTVILGGEKFSIQLAEDIFSGGITTRLVNHYGPTETTIGAACYVLHSDRDIPAGCQSVPIGSAIGDTVLSLADGDTQGEGELIIQGSGVTAGYYGSAHSASQNFRIIHSPDGAVYKTYHTGDRCRVAAPGVYEFLGRSDRRVKVRGYLVDLSTVEKVIEDQPGVRKATVIEIENAGDKRLAAVLFTHVTDPGFADKIRDHLLEKFPSYTIPAHILTSSAPPVTENGKLNYKAVCDFVMAELNRQAAPTGSQPPSMNDLAARIASLWAGYTGLSAIDATRSFIDAGADSILMMRCVAKLRSEGIPVTVEDMYTYPTPEKLGQALIQRKVDGVLPDRPRSPAEEKALAPMQEWFFAQKMSDYDHWNQALLLKSADPVNVAALARTITHVMENNDMLRQKFSSGRAEGLSDGTNHIAFGVTFLPPGNSGPVITQAALALQKSMSLEHGRVFRVQLFQSHDGGGDRILFIAHHLVVDGISWRVLLDDIATGYKKVCAHENLSAEKRPSFWNWTDMRRRTVAPATSARHPFSRPLSKKFTATGHGVAGLSTCVLAFDRASTDMFLQAARNQEFAQSVLLQSFVDSIGEQFSFCDITVDVEGHGRRDVPGSEDFLSTIGWFTSVSAVTLAAGGVGDFSRRVQQTSAQFKAAVPGDLSVPRADVCFNFLGNFSFPLADSVTWLPSHEPIGSCRSAGGEDAYLMRYTARIVDGELVADLIYNPSQVARDMAESIQSLIGQRLSAFLRQPIAPEITHVSGSTAGMLMLTTINKGRLGIRVVSGKQQRTALLTGGTGYLGAHLLNELASNDQFKIKCLVRAENDSMARTRLLDTYASYFGYEQASDLAQKVDVYAGDISQSLLKLESVDLARVDDVFHVAALTRLLAPYKELSAMNIDGVRNIIGWMHAHGRPNLHHVSTLAISGKNIQTECRDYTEEDFDIGQEFLTPYEQSKFEAEKIVRNTMAMRNKTYIYRMGHVAAHSKTGAFQQNISDNRIYQIAKAYVLMGVAPRLKKETLAFSHVDIIAKSIAGIGADATLPSGTFHVESPHNILHSDLIQAIISCGYDVNVVSLKRFIDNIENAASEGNRTAMMASLWMQRESRNLSYRQDKTIAQLSTLGIHFPKPDVEWFRRALICAMEAEFLPAPNSAMPSKKVQRS